MQKILSSPIKEFRLFVILKNINPELEDEDSNFMRDSEILISDSDT